MYWKDILGELKTKRRKRDSIANTATSTYASVVGVERLH